MEEDLYVINEYNITHIDSHKQSYSNIDLRITNRDGIDRIETLTIEDTLNSDHFPLKIIIKLNHKKLHNSRKFKYKLLNKNTNWNVFSEHLRSLSDLFISADYFTLQLVEKHENFWKVVKECVISANSKPNDIINLRDEYNTNIPNPYKRAPASWWDPECTDKKMDRTQALSKAMRTGKIEDFIDWKHEVAIVKKLYKTEKAKELHKVHRIFKSHL